MRQRRLDLTGYGGIAQDSGMDAMPGTIEDETLLSSDSPVDDNGESQSRQLSESPLPHLGKGRLFEDPTHLRQDCAMLQRAIKGRWGVTNTKRRKAVRRLMDIIEHEEDNAVAVTAIRTLIMADGQDVEASKGPSIRQSLTVNVASPGGDPAVQRQLADTAKLLHDMASGSTAGK